MSSEKSKRGLPRVKMDQELGTSYVPKLIARQPKLFSPGMLQLISKAERSFTRIDEHMGASPYLESTQNVLLCLEALSAAIVDGAECDLMALLLHDMKRRLSDSPQAGLRISSSSSSRAVQYRDYLETHNSCANMDDFIFSIDSIVHLYDELNSTRESTALPSFRGLGASGSQATKQDRPHPQGSQVHTLPPERIGEYLADLCEFCNTDYYTPQIQAGLAHFQLEYIRPFETNVEALGRQLSYIIYAKRGFTRNIIVAVAVESVRRVDDPIDDLKADQESAVRQSPLELWIYHGANMLLREAQMIRDIEGSLRDIEGSWRERVAQVRHLDICDFLLHDLLAHPVVNAKYVSECCGKTLPAANDALKKLIAAGVLKPIDARKRNRYFLASDVVVLYRKLVESIMPRGWLPGAELFGV